MKKTMIAGAVVAALTMATAVSAKEGAYYGVGVTQQSIDDTGSGVDVMTLDGRFGAYFNENFSGEVRLGVGITDDDYFGADVEMKHYYGAYLRAGVPVTDGFYPYAIAGYTKAKVEVSDFGVTASDSESDFSYGLGADFSVSKNVDITLEFMRYLDKDGVEIDGIGLGFKARL